MMKAKRLTKGELMRAVRAAIKASLDANSAWITVDHELFKGFVLRARKGRLWRVQQWPSTFVDLDRVSEDGTRKDLWRTEVSYLNTIIDGIVRSGSVTGAKAAE